MPDLPPSDVLSAFGISSHDTVEPLPGGRGLCFRVRDIVLRPSDDDEESQWAAEFALTLTQANPSTTIYRLPIPFAPSTQTSSPPSFVHSGWTAWSFLPGKPAPGSLQMIDTKLAISRAYHADIHKLNLPKPAFLDHLTDRFHLADRITWDELDLEDVPALIHLGILATIKPWLVVFGALAVPFPRPLTCQLIHGDLSGNILFDNDGNHPPGIIDQTPYWRPAEYAEAIIIADGLIWDGHGQDLIDKFGDTLFRLQLLVRALNYRCLAFAIDPDMAFVEAMLPKTDFTAAATAVAVAIDAVRDREAGHV